MKNYFQAPWTIKDIIIIFSCVILLVGLFILGSNYLGLGALVQKSQYQSVIITFSIILQWIIILLPLLIITIKKYKLSWSNFGFRKIGILRNFKLAIGGYLLYLAIAIIITIIIINTGIKIPGFNLEERLLPEFGRQTKDFILAGIIIIAVAPVLEEIFFRGFILRSLANKIGTFYGSIFTALIFALFHLQLQAIIPYFILGLIINSLVIRGKSIYPAITFHIINNAIAFTIELLLLQEIVKVENVI